MLQLPLYSLFIRMIPEAFLVLLSVCLLHNTRINYRNLAIASIIGGAGAYIARLMPIHFGIHTIIGVLLNILLSYYFNNIKLHMATVGILTSVIILFISDTLLFTFYKNVLKLPSEILVGDSVLAVIATLPSLIIFFGIMMIVIRVRGIRKVE